jgi:hypothetical protein
MEADNPAVRMMRDARNMPPPSRTLIPAKNAIIIHSSDLEEEDSPAGVSAMT